MFHVEQLYKMETLTHCPLCKTATTGLNYLQVRDYLVSGQMFNIEQCRTCGFLFTNPRPNILEINTYYQSPDYISHTDEHTNLIDFLYQRIKQHMLKKKLKLLKKHTTTVGKKLLDYGCGTGEFVLAARKNGYEAIGFEPEIKAKNKARQKGVELLENEKGLFSNHTQHFDVITLWHVLEHLHDLHEKMQSFAKILKPGAWLIIAVPMANSADAEFYKEYWAALDVPRHLYHFVPKNISQLCQSHGYKIVKSRGLAFDSFYISLLSEKHKNTKLALVLAMLRGLNSNMNALRRKNPWSSEIFFCQKEI